MARRYFAIFTPVVILMILAAILAVQGRAVQSATQDDIAILMGSSGRVTTLECYEPEPTRDHPAYSNKPDPFAPCTNTDYNLDGLKGAHAHTLALPIDISASSGSDVWVQNDYLDDSEIRGGYLYAENLSSYCADLTGNQYNGKKTRVLLYYYDDVGLADGHYVLYQHIDPASGSLGDWKHWNNAGSSNPLWASWMNDFYMNNLTSGGFQIGDVAVFGSNPPSQCAQGAHLHQEIDGTGSLSAEYNLSKWADGCYDGPGTQSGCAASGPGATFDWVVGGNVTGGFSDAHHLTIDLN